MPITLLGGGFRTVVLKLNTIGLVDHVCVTELTSNVALWHGGLAMVCASSLEEWKSNA